MRSICFLVAGFLGSWTCRPFSDAVNESLPKYTETSHFPQPILYYMSQFHRTPPLFLIPTIRPVNILSEFGDKLYGLKLQAEN